VTRFSSVLKNRLLVVIRAPTLTSVLTVEVATCYALLEIYAVPHPNFFYKSDGELDLCVLEKVLGSWTVLTSGAVDLRVSLFLYSR